MKTSVTHRRGPAPPFVPVAVGLCTEVLLCSGTAARSPGDQRGCPGGQHTSYPQ